jgi:outer membrane protein OmpA-like peptidoglycan-associated protein
MSSLEADRIRGRMWFGMAPLLGLLVALSIGLQPVTVLADDDHDAVPEERDFCPQLDEDPDGYLDNDGCPDADNDGDGIADIRDRCPLTAEDVDGFVDVDGCPDWDNDRDGIADGFDGCPRVAEDRDGQQDADGCRDPDDRDGDRLTGIVDKCPMTAETANGFQDMDGCPDAIPAPMPVACEVTELPERVHFEPGSASIDPGAYGALDEVAYLLRAHPEIARVVIEGHSDSSEQGQDPYDGWALSQARGEAIRGYLLSQGIDPQRLMVQQIKRLSH